jgi:hypothetical protein
MINKAGRRSWDQTATLVKDLGRHRPAVHPALRSQASRRRRNYALHPAVVLLRQHSRPISARRSAQVQSLFEPGMHSERVRSRIETRSRVSIAPDILGTTSAPTRLKVTHYGKFK